jgi:hypothetical protein
VLIFPSIHAVPDLIFFLAVFALIFIFVFWFVFFWSWTELVWWNSEKAGGYFFGCQTVIGTPGETLRTRIDTEQVILQLLQGGFLIKGRAAVAFARGDGVNGVKNPCEIFAGSDAINYAFLWFHNLIFWSWF